jgi:hypothetical protein
VAVTRRYLQESFRGVSSSRVRLEQATEIIITPRDPCGGGEVSRLCCEPLDLYLPSAGESCSVHHSRSSCSCSSSSLSWKPSLLGREEEIITRSA